VDFDAHHQLARRAASEGSVLLANAGQLLPLAPESGGRIALIGEFARTPRYQGAGSSHINPTRLDNALTAVREATSREVAFEPGFTFDGGDPVLQSAAVEAARDAEVVVAFLGLPPQEESEGFDRTSLGLPDAQIQLLQAILEVNPNVVLVLSSGGVITLPPVAGRIPAILEMWLGGQGAGSAAADLLFGRTAPGGRLAETIPVKLSDNPAHVNWPGHDGRVLYGERIYVGYRWYDATEREVAFPFGFGLTYTTFEYSDLHVHVPNPSVAAATVEVTVTNTGPRAGSEVVQAYVSDAESDIDRPLRELKAFRKVHLAPGESRRVKFELDERAFAYWGREGWTVDPGDFGIEIGASSRDIRQRASITFSVPAPARQLRNDSTFDEWMAHPVGRLALQTLLDQLGDAAAPLMDPDTIKLIASMPLANIVSMAGGADGRIVVAELLGQVDGSSPELQPQH
jgi:beta-glucosidase